VKPAYRYLPLLLLFVVPLAQAQSSRHRDGDETGPYNFAIGFGTAQAPSNGSGIENASSANAFASCTPSVLDSTCQRNPALGRLFMGFDGDAMINKRFGFGGEINFQPAKGDYGPLEYRQMFYDFNGLYTPIRNDRFTLRLEGGIGGAHTGFSYLQSSCVGTAVCSSQSLSVGTSNHFQEHVGVGVQVNLTRHVFIRPQFDYHYVHGFTDQFGRDSVLQGSVWLGYNFGEF